MSRSRRRSPFMGVGGDSDKSYKTIEHHKFRARVRALLLRHLEDPESDTPFPGAKEFGDPWGGSKDGKMFFGNYKWPHSLARFMCYPFYSRLSRLSAEELHQQHHAEAHEDDRRYYEYLRK